MKIISLTIKKSNISQSSFQEIKISLKLYQMDRFDQYLRTKLIGFISQGTNKSVFFFQVSV